MLLFTIKDIEQLSGIKAHTIRIWEQRYTFLKPKRTGSNIRYYTSNELKTILDISLLNKYGCKISQANQLLPGEVEERINSLSTAEAMLDRLLNELLKCMADININGFENILNEFTLKQNIHQTIACLISPFMDKARILLPGTNLIPLHHQPIINIFRQKLVKAIESISNPPSTNKTIILFLPENESYELGLLNMNYILKNKGMNVIYLGADVPVKDVEWVIIAIKPDFIYTNLNSSKLRTYERLLQEIKQQFKNTITVIAGPVPGKWKNDDSNHIYLMPSMQEAYDFINLS